jgi:hypothetical protein
LAAVIITTSVYAFFHLQEAIQLFGLIPAQALRLHGLTFVTSFSPMPESFISSATCISFSFSAMTRKIFWVPLRYIALIAIAVFVGDLLHIALAPNSTIPLHRRQRWNRRCDHILCIGIPANENRLFVALLLLLSLDSAAGAVRFRALDFFPNHRCLRTKDRNQLGFVPCAFGRSRSRPGYVVSYAKNHTSRSGVGTQASGLCATQGSSPVFRPPSCNFADALYSSDPVRG